METGIKQLDKLIVKHGISAQPTHNAFQSSMRLFPDDPRLMSLRLPYCMHKIVQELRVGDSVTLHRFYLSYHEKTPRLAFFLMDDDGSIIEKVFFLKNHRYQKASKALYVHLRQSVLSDRVAA